MDLSKLKTPFSSEDIEWRIQQSGIGKKGPWGMCLAYIQNRAIMERLDDVCGPGNWKNHFEKAPDGGVLCGISIKIGKDWVTKWDGATNTDIESVKGGLSNAMKRAAVQWGIGRYLYNLSTGWANFVEKDGKYKAKIENKYYSWNPPLLPEWALPVSYLDTMKGFAINNKGAYKKVLDHWQIDSAKKITLPDSQGHIIEEIEKEIAKTAHLPEQEAA